MARSKSAARWLKEHFSDPYVKAAQQEGKRARAAYKLIDILKKNPFLKPGMTVLDLGAAPGSWSQVVADCIGGAQSTIIAVDCLPMVPISGVTFLQGDFSQTELRQQLRNQLQGKLVDVILSDIAPNMSGNRTVDQLRVIGLMEQVYVFSQEVLSDPGKLLLKGFYGAGFDAFLKQARQDFQQVRIYKPSASRSRSSECYIMMSGKKGC